MIVFITEVKKGYNRNEVKTVKINSVKIMHYNVVYNALNKVP